MGGFAPPARMAYILMANILSLNRSFDGCIPSRESFLCHPDDPTCHSPPIVVQVSCMLSAITPFTWWGKTYSSAASQKSDVVHCSSFCACCMASFISWTTSARMDSTNIAAKKS